MYDFPELIFWKFNMILDCFALDDGLQLALEIHVALYFQYSFMLIET